MGWKFYNLIVRFRNFYIVIFFIVVFYVGILEIVEAIFLVLKCLNNWVFDDIKDLILIFFRCNVGVLVMFFKWIFIF